MRWNHRCTNCGHEGDQTTLQPPHVFSKKCPKCGKDALEEI